MRLLGEWVVVREVAWSSFCLDTRTGCLVAGMSGDPSPARRRSAPASTGTSPGALWEEPGAAADQRVSAVLSFPVV